METACIHKPRMPHEPLLGEHGKMSSMISVFSVRMCLCTLALWVLLVLQGEPAAFAAAGMVKQSSTCVAVTPGGELVLAVNPDSHSLTLVDAAARRVLAEIRVGADPRCVTLSNDGSTAFVANRGAHSVSVVDLGSLEVVDEVAVGYLPYGILAEPEGRWLYVAEQGADLVRVIEQHSGRTHAEVAVPDRPSGLALGRDGRTLYVTHLLRPVVSVVDVSGIDEKATARTEIELWPDSNLVQSIVVSPDGLEAFVPHTRSNTANRALTFDTTVFPVVSRLDLEAGTHLAGAHLALGTLDPPGVGLPFDVALTPDGNEIWVVNAASNDITVVDLATATRRAHIEVGANPRGIVMSPDGRWVYVNNTLSGTLSVIDRETARVVDTLVITQIPLPPVLLRGKRLFHSSDDPRMSRAQWISCNTCHFEGEHDGRTWFFGFAGPRNTTSLAGMIRTYPLRWSGEWDESADAEFAMRRENFGAGLLAGAMACALAPPDCTGIPFNQGNSDDLDSLAAFMDSLRLPRSPSHARGEPLSAAEQRGRRVFERPQLGCITCHPPPLYTDQKKHDVGTATPDERIGPEYDTPTLLGLWASAPYFHDGSAATLAEALTRPTPGREHDVRGRLEESEIQDLVAFLTSLPYE